MGCLVHFLHTAISDQNNLVDTCPIISPKTPKRVPLITTNVNPTSTSGDTCKTIIIILFKLLSIGDSYKFKATH